VLVHLLTDMRQKYTFKKIRNKFLMVEEIARIAGKTFYYFIVFYIFPVSVAHRQAT